MKGRHICIVITILLLALLAGCAAEPVTNTPQPKGGTLYITVNPVIAVTYDAEGNVTSITAVTEDAKDIVGSFQNFAGKECAEVVAELVTKIGEEGYLSKDKEDITIAITFEKESGVPKQDFLEDIKQQVQTVVATNQWQGTVTVEAPEVSSEEPDDPAGNANNNAQEADPPPQSGNVPEGAVKQPDGTYLLTERLDTSGNPSDGQSEPAYTCTTVYDAKGIKLSQTTFNANGVKIFYQEFYPTGNPKNYKRWNDSGVLAQEFSAFHDKDSSNGIIKYYDEQGNLQGLDTFGNPDGSPDTSEIWDADGTHIVTAIADGQPLQVAYTYSDGGFLTETYNYEAGTVHITAQRSQGSWDMISSMETGEFIEGYQESTVDGIYHRSEYVNGYKSKEIFDGETNPLGYTYKRTTYYYSNGQTKSTESYYYADSGRTYVEFDEQGTTTYWEDTTECNYGVVGP